MRRPLTLLLITASVLLAACGRDNVRPDLPGADHAVLPEVVVVERLVYVEIPPELTQPLPVAEGPIAQCFGVAAERRKAIEVANSRLREIDAIEGTEVDGAEVAP